jgi:hypothetical protein
VNLATTETTRTRAVDALTAYLPTAQGWTGQVARALLDLATTETTRTRAVDALTAYLPTAGWWPEQVVETLRSLCLPVEWLRILRQGH